jgi:hypothetical protein
VLGDGLAGDLGGVVGEPAEGDLLAGANARVIEIRGLRQACFQVRGLVDELAEPTAVTAAAGR